MSSGAGIMDQTLARMRQIVESVSDPMVDEWDPLELGVLFSKLEYEELNVGTQLEAFDVLSREMKAGLTTAEKGRSFKERSEWLLNYFSKTLDFSGDQTNYYNIKNSFLNDVYLRRKGIPISLSLVFMGLVRRCGLRAVGIAFPGHFLVRMVPSQGYMENVGGLETAEDWKSTWYLDCFDSQVLSVADCEARLRAWTRGMIPFGPDSLKIAHPTDILSRMLRNLRATLMEKEDLPRLYWVLSALIELCPQDRVESIRERGLLMARMGRFPGACRDFKEYLSVSTDAEKKGHVQKMLEFFSRQTEMAN